MNSDEHSVPDERLVGEEQVTADGFETLDTLLGSLLHGVIS
jgi:hypothetical protein